jgi:hypothetical protein
MVSARLQSASVSVRVKLVGELEKDLVKTPDRGLRRRVSDWVSPERRPPI